MIWNRLLQSSQYHDRRSAIASVNARSRHLKRGIAITPVKFGISFTATFYNQAGAVVLVYRDGTVQVNHGGTEMGQGLFTKIQQVAAQELGVPQAHVRVMPTRTDKVPNTSATAASSGSDLNGGSGCLRPTQKPTRSCGSGGSGMRPDRGRLRERSGVGARENP
jgi:xanthine dehydrogenase molybdopterin-binding subunit B